MACPPLSPLPSLLPTDDPIVEDDLNFVNEHQDPHTLTAKPAPYFFDPLTSFIPRSFLSLLLPPPLLPLCLLPSYLDDPSKIVFTSDDTLVDHALRIKAAHVTNKCLVGLWCKRELWKIFEGEAFLRRMFPSILPLSIVKKV
ncbi:hypothetical protein RJT34_16221 [Clitoria ternatea]|uniref:Uncharacterized protein n=1 Tax=Clitoria ternatea TaxID=43366 RepID=A0AAN9PDG6_CLITE